MIYSNQIARQYKAYRPPLHKVILRECLKSKDSFARALDIGCGVGHSSIALLPYCEHIIGVDSSQSMLDEALVNDKVSYEILNEFPLRWDEDTFDLITFSGSLFYCKSQALIQDCLRLITDSGTIVVYDFTLNLNPVLINLGFLPEKSDYDPTINLDDVQDLRLQFDMLQKHALSITREHLAHILLTDTTISKQLALNNSNNEEENVILNLLLEKIETDSFICHAELYCRSYQIRG